MIFKRHSVFPTVPFSVISKIKFKLLISQVCSNSESNVIGVIPETFRRLAHLHISISVHGSTSITSCQLWCWRAVEDPADSRAMPPHQGFLSYMFRT
jgi:hypothetical protein